MIKCRGGNAYNFFIYGIRLCNKNILICSWYETLTFIVIVTWKYELKLSHLLTFSLTVIIIKWYPSFLYQSCTFILYPLKTHRPIRKCKLPLIFKDGLQELYLPPKMHCGLECTHAVLLGGSVWSTHAAERSACWKYDFWCFHHPQCLLRAQHRAAVFLPLIPPHSLLYFEVGAGHWAQGIIKRKRFFDLFFL